MKTINITADDGIERAFFIEAETRLNGADYLLVTDGSDDDEVEVLILKDISEVTDEEACYVLVTDPVECEALLNVFQEILDQEEFEE
ncbi:MAG: DUF1292 domain-containing protein [Lachnospiraceae bacterium]|nr:DUF1292 domain-containing protein [Candidatus Equihabitans merdae]